MNGEFIEQFTFDDIDAKQVIRIFDEYRDAEGKLDSAVLMAAAFEAMNELDWQRTDKRPDAIVASLPTLISGISDFDLAAFSCFVAQHANAGLPFGVAEEAEEVFQAISPKVGGTANTNATPGEFRFHSDNAALLSVFRPESISLACAVNEAHAETGIVHCELIVDKLPKALRRAAFEYRFSHVVPPSFGDSCIGKSEIRPLFEERGDGIHVAMTTYRTNPVDPKDTDAANTIRAIEEIAQAHATWVDLQPGQILLFRNDRTLHARKAIAGNRKLIRAYWRQNLSELRRFASTNAVHMYSAKKALLAGGAL